jgi:hypothetical protein
MYYKDCDTSQNLVKRQQHPLMRNYIHFGAELQRMNDLVKDWKSTGVYDSIKLVYADNLVQDFYGYGLLDFVHLHFRYFSKEEIYSLNQLEFNRYNSYREEKLPLKLSGQYDREHAKIGTWSYFNKHGGLTKTENYIYPEPDPIPAITASNANKEKSIAWSKHFYRLAEKRGW